MGKTIEILAKERGHVISHVYDSKILFPKRFFARQMLP